MQNLIGYFFLFLLVFGLARPQRPACVRSSCYPATGDLLIGRESQLTASSTCGIPVPTTYCILSHLVERNASAPLANPLANQQCFVCDSSKPYFPSYSPNSHRIENVVSKIPRDRNRWWQSVNGLHNVSIRLDLEAEFHFTHLIMTFKTFRPAAMYIERSFDFGRSWNPYRYYSSNCLADFPTVSRNPMRRIGDVVCSSDYTDMEPSTGGEVIFRAVPSHLQKIDDPYSEEVQNLVKLTNLRIVFTRLHTLGDLAFDSRPEVINNYYYALFELNVRGSCSCYGHAQRCVPADPSQVIDNMVYGRCECTHQTTGMNCHKCLPFYNDLPWKPATLESSNECKKCECNQHATRCHFDAAVFKASEGVSGGVCDQCAHNTQGKNCQECQPFYFQDDKLPLSSPEICKPCNCDPFGSENRGECEQKTDLAAKTIAGRCICKKNAGGKRCDRCKPGFWNFDATNPNACDKCKCFLPGTFRNQGCDQKTGSCTCKRFVTGPLCDKCMPGYYGLAEKEIEGCKPCDCQPGGSKAPLCDPVTGNCPCVEGVEGRRCDKVTPGYFAPRIDVQVYEAEKKKSDGTGTVVKMPDNVSGPKTHTGTGGVLLGPKDTVNIKISPPPPPGDYEVAIRIVPKEFGGKEWPNFRVKVIRPTVPNPNSYCGKKGAKKEESFLININATTGAIFIPKSICIGPNETITIRIEANDKTKPNPNAKVIIDSVVLVPDAVKRIKKPKGSTMNPTEDWNYCRDLLLSLLPTQLPQRCKKLLPVISLSVFGPKKCQCNPTGSLSLVCDANGGQCRCKPGMTGRKCDKCKDEHYGFGPTGCKPCLCDPRGSHFLQCDPVTGACFCKDNAYGRRCNECKRGFWNFPTCIPCLCNRHTDTCDSLTGRCTNCTDFTGGDHCEKCRPGYYGDPRIGKNIRCKPCLCPLGIDSGVDRSVGCVLDSLTNLAKCLCQKGYAGNQCEKCAPNFFGNPLDPKSKCRPCDCNNNIDRTIPDSCDSTTGICLRCQYNTKGSNCHECSDGFYGNATRRQCKECICFKLGTKPSGKQCDRKTGQCACLPNVIGQRCDRCAPFHWNITSKEGCKSCSCDPSGSKGPACNLLGGQCECLPGRGGRDCSECEATFWGQPGSIEGCKKCKCHPLGSKTMQCNRRTGKCVCKPGVAGEFCDRCDRGTRGVFPNCVPCGECWINWYRIISELMNETETFRLSAGKISGGLNLPKDYVKDLVTIEKQLDEIAAQLGDNKITSIDLKKLKDQLAKIKEEMENKKVDEIGLSELQKKLEENAKNEKRTSDLKDTLDQKIANLRSKVEELAKEAIQIKESNLAGAFQTVKENKKKSDEALAKIAGMDSQTQTLRKSLDVTKDRLKAAKEALDSKLKDLNTKSALLKEAIRKLKENALPELNKKICGGDWKIPFKGDPVCLPSCGGGGCPDSKCGGSSVCEGSRDLQKTTEQHLADAERLLNKKMTTLGNLMDKLKKLTADADAAKTKAEEARTKAKTIDNLSKDQEMRVKKLLKQMQDLLDAKGSRQAELENLLKEIESFKSPMTDAEIEKLKQAILDKVNRLKDVNKILQDTKKDREATEKLKNDAALAKKEAEDLLKKANDIDKSRTEAVKAQEETKKKLASLKDKTDKMKKLLDIIKDLDDMTGKINKETDNHLKNVNAALNELENQKKEIETKINAIENENKQNAKAADDIMKEMMNRLAPKIGEAKSKIEGKERLVGVLSARAQKLKNRIKKVADSLNDKLKRLDEAEKNKNVAKNLLDNTDTNLKKLMDEILTIFKRTREKVNKHSTC